MPTAVVNAWAAISFGAVDMKRTKKITYSALFTALGVAILSLASLTEIADLAISMFASALLMLALIELGEKWGFMIFGGTSLLALLLLPSKFIAAVYLVFTGLYPLIKRHFDRLPKVLSVLLKLVYFNTSLTLALLLAKFVFLIDTYADWLLVLYYLLSNLCFWLFDLLIRRLTAVYLIRWRITFRRFFK